MIFFQYLEQVGIVFLVGGFFGTIVGLSIVFYSSKQKKTDRGASK